MATTIARATSRQLSLKEVDIQMMLATEVHLGIYIINLDKTWEKLQLAARVIVAIENPQDIIVQSARPYGQRAVLKFAQHTSAHAIAGRHTPAFTFQVSELIALYQRYLLDIINMVAIDHILVVLYITNMCGKVCERLQEKCIKTIIKSDVDVVTLDKALPHHIVKQVLDSHLELGLDKPENIGFSDKHVKMIHQALDSDDVELVRMLLKKSHTNLDEAYALYYVVAYYDEKTTTELLDLGLADVNRRNSRGYTVLHVAAMTNEPKIIVSLLTKGARPYDLTLQGRKALQFSKRLTKAVDYYISTEEGKASPKNRLCIEAGKTSIPHGSKSCD
ncbi:hypothetical protein REPUB_Repub03eG0100800 [Reevesia pubescens]